MSEWLELAKTQPLFAVCMTITAYAMAEMLWKATGRPALLNPVLIATTLVATGLILLGIPYDAYLLQVQPINQTLALLIVLLAVPLCRQFHLIRRAGFPIGLTLVTGSAVAISSALLLPALVGLEPGFLATIAPKSATTAVAVQVSERLGGLSGLTAVIVISTGIFGAAFGPSILDAAGVLDHRAKGFALGVASHAIGTARAFQISEVAGAFASLGMILNGLLTMLLVPLVLQLV